MNNSKIRFAYGLFLALFTLLTIGFFPGDPPGGKTGAPGDGLCTDCHATGNALGLNGGINITNFPSSIVPGQSYMLTASVTNPNGLAARAGFQAVVLDQSNQNTGDLFSTSSNPATQTLGSREYMEHRPALNFPASNEVSWNFMWTAPNGPGGEGITLYASAVIASGTSGNSDDLVVTTQVNGVLQTVADPLVLTITNTTDALCFGEPSGSATASATGGAGGYTFQWSNGMSGASTTATGFAAGTHSVTVSDSDGAMASTTFSISQPAQPLVVNLISQSNIDCNNQFGSATVQASGGTPGYSYSWTNGSNNPTQNTLPAGAFVVTVTDQNLCVETFTVVISEDINAPTANAGPNKSLTCAVSQVTLDGSASSVGINIAYSWFNQNGVEISNTITATVSQTGVYSLVVTNSENGCTSESSVTVNEIPGVILTIDGTDPSCSNGSDGEIDLTIASGESPFIIDWNVNALDGIENPTGLSAGFYEVTVTDANSCTAVTSFTLTSPDEIVLNAVIGPISCNGDCDGQMEIMASGGAGGYIYEWSNGLPSSAFQVGLCADQYSVTVTDGNDCSATTIIDLTEPTALMATLEIDHVSCNGECDGMVTATATGGNPPYTYEWSDSQNTPVAQNICVGPFGVTITDSNGCFITQTVVVNEPAELEVQLVESAAVSCNGLCDATIDVLVTGGTGTFTYDWDALPDVSNQVNVCAGTYNLTVTDANGCFFVAVITIDEPETLVLSGTTSLISCFGAADGAINTSVVGGTGGYNYDWDDNILDGTADPNSLSSGVYTLTVTDVNGCTDEMQWTINEPNQLTLTVSSTGETASGADDGTATASAAGGTGPFSYVWSNAETTAQIMNLTPDNYSVTVTDANGCSETGSTTVSSFDCNLSVSLNEENVSCNGLSDGSITSTVENGTAPITYAWSNNTALANLNGVSAGTYTVTVTDADNCEVVASAAITEPSELNATLQEIPVSCSENCDGALNLTISGGTGPYNIMPAELTNLCTGNYTVTITDANGCEIVLNGSVLSPNSIAIETSSTSVTTVNGNDGTATAVGTGGTGILSYSWSNGESSSTITGLSSGEYCVTVSDANNCFSTECVTVNDISCDVEVVLNTSNTDCAGAENGTAEVVTLSGVEPFSYSWSSSSNTSAIETGLSEGVYQVTITDAAGCELVESFTITSPDALELTFNVVHESSAGANDGEASAQVSGGTGGYTYFWNTTETTMTITGLAPGEYCVTVVDENDCAVESCVIVNSGDCTLAAMLDIEDVLCFGESSGAATVASVTGGMPPISYAWSSSNNTSDTEVGLTAGSYTVTVSDAANCQEIINFEIEEPALLDITATAQGETVAGANDGSVTTQVSGGTGPYIYEWNVANDTGQPGLEDLAPGEYCVTVIDGNDCSASTCVTVSPGGCTLAATIETTDVNCFGDANGSAVVSVTGATEPVTYSWSSSGNTSNTETGLAAGEYSVTINDAAGCEVVLTYAINSPLAISLELIVQNVSAPGADDGEINAMVEGGSGDYTFEWSPAVGNTSSLINLAPGVYCVTVTDADGCSAASCGTVNMAGCDLEIGMIAVTPSCTSPCNGAIDLTIAGGVEPLVFSWDDPTIGDVEDPLGLCPGTYSVTVTDANNCSVVQAITVEEESFVVMVETNAVLSCEACMSSITLTPQGDGPFDYDWSDDQYDGMSMLTELCSGQYSCTVSNENGCQEVIGLTITEPEILSVVVEATASCPDICNGDYVATVTGGSPPYSFLITGTSNPPGEMCPGTYMLTVTDAGGCEVETQVVIDELPEVEFQVLEVGPDIDGQGTGFINISAVSSLPLSFSWLFDGTIVSEEMNPQNLLAGQYILLIAFGDCLFASETIIVDLVSNTNDFAANELTIFPNPTSNELFIEMSNGSNSMLQFDQLQLFDSRGGVVELNQTTNNYSKGLQLDLAQLTTGVYLLKYQLGDRVEVAKIMVIAD